METLVDVDEKIEQMHFQQTRGTVASSHYALPQAFSSAVRHQIHTEYQEFGPDDFLSQCGTSCGGADTICL